MFVELFAPAICAACAMFGGFQAGVSVHDIDVGIGSVNRRQSDGQIEHDTVFASASAALWRRNGWSAGAFGAFTFNPTPEGGPHSVQAGPYGEYAINRHLATRLYVLVDPVKVKDTTGMFSVLWRR